jgi:hypothetical protein
MATLNLLPPHNNPASPSRRGTNAMSVNREDNFGFYCIDNDLEELEFFCYIKLQSKPKICVRCRQNVRLLKHIKVCATCSQALEYGASSDPALPL